jgi:hypothetical protein
MIEILHADALNRAADRLEQMTGAANGPDGPGHVRWADLGGSVIWAEEPAAVVVARHCTGPEAKYIAAVDPVAVAALVPALRMAARGTVGLTGLTLTVNERRLIEPLLAFARRVLREEEE